MKKTKLVLLMPYSSKQRTARRLSDYFPSKQVSDGIVSTEQGTFEEFDRQSYRLFKKLRHQLGETYSNWFLIIEPDSEDYFLAEDELVAYQQAISKHPQGKFFFFRLNETGVHGHL